MGFHRLHHAEIALAEMVGAQADEIPDGHGRFLGGLPSLVKCDQSPGHCCCPVHDHFTECDEMFAEIIRLFCFFDPGGHGGISQIHAVYGINILCGIGIHDIGGQRRISQHFPVDLGNVACVQICQRVPKHDFHRRIHHRCHCFFSFPLFAVRLQYLVSVYEVLRSFECCQISLSPIS